jgi:hypothetical protein
VSVPPDRSADVLVVAAWRDTGGFRARITFAAQDTPDESASFATHDPDRVLELVEQWLRRVGARDDDVTER